MSQTEKEFTPSPDVYVNAWQHNEAKQAAKNKKVAKTLLAATAASAAVASGIGYAEGDVQQTALTDVAIAGGLLGASTLPGRRYEQHMDQVRNAGTGTLHGKSGDFHIIQR